MADWMMGLGAGLQSLGGNAMQYLMQQQERERQKQLQEQAAQQRQAELDAQRRQQDQQMRFSLQKEGFDFFEPIDAPIRQAETVGSALGGLRGATLPGGMGIGLADTGDALSKLAKDARERAAKGRTFDYTDTSGKTTKYYQPYERTEQGKAEQARADLKQSFLKLGMPEERADALSKSPDEVRKFFLEQYYPKPTGQPRQIVQPDGTVTYVQPPAMKPGEQWSPGLRQRTPPEGGSAPYNWTVQTDDMTGEVVLVDPRTGQSKPVTAPGGAPLMNVPDQVKKKAQAFGAMRANLEMLKQLVEKHGIEVMPGEAKSAMESALSQAQVAWKTYAELGALSGPDMGMVIAAIGDPTSIMAGVQGGDKGVLAKLNTALKALGNEERLFTEAYKVPIPGRTVPPGSELTPQEQAIYDAAKREGKSDAEIMAFLQKMRGGGL
jgi:type II secretory pathway pseudopilin PulG